MHHESIIGYLQTQASRTHFNSSLRQSYSAISAWVASAASEIIPDSQRNNYLKLVEPNEAYETGLRALTQENQPLWIFSLNYDLVIECLAAKFRIKLNAGCANILQGHVKRCAWRELRIRPDLPQILSLHSKRNLKSSA
jgi:hypothetical protein